MSDVVDIGTWENELLGIKIFYIKVNSEFWFLGKEAAETFEFKKTTDAIKNHVFYDYKITFGDFLNRLSPKSQTIFRTPHFTESYFRIQKSQILINEPGFYQLASKSSYPHVESFQRWVYSTIKEIRETGFYILPGIKHLSLEERKEATEYVVEHDSPEFVFGGDNSERSEIHGICKKGVEKSKNLLQSIWSKKGGDKSADNTIKARNFTKEVASKSIDDLNKMSQDDLYEYHQYLILKSRDIVKEFTT